MFQTTIKYVIIALKADNNGEGGIFSLYALVKRYSGRWLLFPAIIGGAFLLADGIITPPISISSAVEGLRIYSPELPTVPIVIAIVGGIFYWLASSLETPAAPFARSVAELRKDADWMMALL